MENLLDTEECIPPTPVLSNKVCSRVDKTLVNSSKLSRKVKTAQNGFKRKRIISPVKSVKQKVKQVTLYNFLLKNNKTNPLPDIVSNLSSPAKVNLLTKFEENENKIDLIPTEVTEKIAENVGNTIKPMSTDDILTAVTINHTENASNATKSMSSNIIPTVVNLTKNKTSDEPDVNECDAEICKEVASLELNSQSRINCTLNVTKNANSCNENKMQTSVIQNEEKLEDMNQTFSYMLDKEGFEVSFNFMEHDIPSNCFNFAEDSSEDNYMKFKVKEVKKDYSKNEIELVIVAVKDSDVVKNCYLRGFWADTVIQAGDIVNVLYPLKSEKTIIDNDAGFLVVNPDFLISSTAVVSTLFCMRKAVLTHILPHWSPGNKIMLIGSLVHDIFQKSVNKHATTSLEVMSIVKSVMEKKENMIALCCQDLSEKEIEQKICNYIPNLIEWINKHCSFKGKNTFADVSITNVEDIEENIWCPKYGIKGKIDMTVKVDCPNKAGCKIMPLELKTGRPTFSAEHIGQVNLYSLMMEERSKETPDGLLLYIRDKSEMKVIHANHNAKRGLIQLRNELASYIYKWVSLKHSSFEEIEECHLPKPINNKRNCENCSYLLPCTLYQKAYAEEKYLDSSHAMNILITSSVKHLTDQHIKYFLHWSSLLMLENTATSEIKAFWTEDADSREKQGMCLSYVVLDKNIFPRQEAEDGYFIHTFVRLLGNPVSADFSNSCLKEGDYVAISNQENPKEVAVAMGYIIAVKEQLIEIAIERNLGTLNHLKNVTFRIDKIISNSAAACIRNNLMLLMQQEEQASKLRKLIIDKEAPKFLEVLPKQIVLSGRSILKCLNKIQQKAVLKAMMAEDYFLIKGMPGTGKTSTIVALVRLLVKMKISVLLTSYTHSAIDNILLKLKDHIHFVRIGPMYRIHPEIIEYSFENLTKDFNSVGQFSTFMKESMIVATTSLGINHAIFKLRKFDVCIVDEASQINQIACLGPLFFAKKFILVGDDKQLPPLVLNNVARRKGMQESLFERLQNSSSCIELNVQYRMNQEIMRLCNELTYNNCLQCGSEEVAKAVIYLDKNSENADKFPDWLLSALDTNITKSVCFLNTDNYELNSEKNQSDSEADLVTLTVQFLLQHKVDHSSIGIIAPYRKQVDLIEAKLKNLRIYEVEINTVDQYQGRDKDIIIISCVKPGDILPKTEKTGSILDDEKRLNVAISRARKKMILIGSKKKLSSYRPFKYLIDCLRDDQFLDVT